MRKLIADIRYLRKNCASARVVRNIIRLLIVSRLYEKDMLLDSLLNECLRHEIMALRTDHFEGKVWFSNGTEFKYWNANRFYAWLSSGKIGEYKYHKSCVRRITMIRFYVALHMFDGIVTDRMKDGLLCGDVEFTKI